MILRLLATIVLLALAGEAGYAADNAPAAPAPPPAGSRHTIKGHASYYAPEFDGRPMADGKPLRLDSNAAASKTLPLGTKAKVTNLKNSRTATVKIEDRGPYVPGRVIDVTPKVADQLGMKQDGVSPVKVEPLPATH